MLDLNMIEEDGLSIVRDLKRQANVPVIMLTGTASAIDRVVGLELGADDCSAKPCELRELVARIRSVLRRAPSAVTSSAPALEGMPRSVRFGTKLPDLETRLLVDENGAKRP